MHCTNPYGYTSYHTVITKEVDYALKLMFALSCAEHGGHPGGLAHRHPAGGLTDRLHQPCPGLPPRLLDQGHELLGRATQAVP